jgi:hypothetical protein
MLCGFYMEGLRKNMKNLWIVGVFSQAWTRYSLNASQKCYFRQCTWYINDVIRCRYNFILKNLDCVHVAIQLWLTLSGNIHAFIVCNIADYSVFLFLWHWSGIFIAQKACICWYLAWLLRCSGTPGKWHATQ